MCGDEARVCELTEEASAGGVSPQAEGTAWHSGGMEPLCVCPPVSKFSDIPLES